MLIIGNGRMITRDPANPFFENGAVAMEGNVIRKVGTTEDMKKAYPDAEYIDAKG
ncbi:chlorohydrolase, partial [Clostridioides difficile]|nr:chlorohydrolase [Clostridioides difficile]